MKKRVVMFIFGMFLLSLAVVMTGCGKSNSEDKPTYTVSGTVSYSPDSGADITLQGITVEARDPSDDSLFASTTTDANGAFSVSVPENQDFYLHATGATIGTTTYVSVNLQVMLLSADRTGIEIPMISETDLTDISNLIGITDTSNNAFFGFDVMDNNGNGIAGVNLTVSPPVTKIFCQQTDKNFIESTVTTTETGPSVVGYVAGGNGTYTFTLYGATGFTIDAIFRLRLIPGEVSMPINP